MTLACLRPRVAGFALRAFALVLLASCTAVFATPCDALRRGLTLEQRAKFGLSSQPCEQALGGSTRSDYELSAAELPVGDISALVDSSALDAALTIDSSRSALRRASQLALYDAQRALVAVAGFVPSPASGLTRPAQPVAARASAGRSGSPTPASMLRALSLSPDVDAVARRHDIDPLLLHAIAHVESRHNADAVSRAGALGVMQVMPATARRFGIDAPSRLRDAPTNLDVSASYLKTLQRRFGNDLSLILAAYNAGEGAVERHGRRIPPFAETRQYVDEVLARYELLGNIARSLGAVPRSYRPTL